MKSNHRPGVFLPPMICDVAATTVQYLGLGLCQPETAARDERNSRWSKAMSIR